MQNPKQTCKTTDIQVSNSRHSATARRILTDDNWTVRAELTRKSFSLGETLDCVESIIFFLICKLIDESVGNVKSNRVHGLFSWKVMLQLCHVVWLGASIVYVLYVENLHLWVPLGKGIRSLSYSD